MKVSLKVSSKLIASVDHLHLIVIATEVILCYFVREDIPAKLIFTEVSPIGGLYVEINLSGIYNPNKHNITEYIETLSKSIDLFSSNYENLLSMGDFNAGLDNAQI